MLCCPVLCSAVMKLMAVRWGRGGRAGGVTLLAEGTRGSLSEVRPLTTSLLFFSPQSCQDLKSGSQQMFRCEERMETFF